MAATWMTWAQSPWMARDFAHIGLLQFGDRATELATRAESPAAYLDRALPQTAAELGGEWAALACRDDSGDPLDAAILEHAGPAADERHERIRVFPFTEARRRETAIWRGESGGSKLDRTCRGTLYTIPSSTERVWSTLAPSEAISSISS